MDKEQGGSKRRSDDVYSKSLRAGKRTYFFDVKSTKSEDLYLTITESKRRFNKDNGKFYYEKHKLFLYPEDFESFTSYLEQTLEKIKELMGGEKITSRQELKEQREKEKETEQNTEKTKGSGSQAEDEKKEKEDSKNQISSFSDVSFEDLGNNPDSEEGDKD